MTSDTLRDLNLVLESFVANLQRINAKHMPARSTPTPKRDVIHGANRYSTYKCRCNICRAAKIESNRQYRARALKEGRINHGTINGYNIGCRCDQCTDTHRQYHASRPPRKR